MTVANMNVDVNTRPERESVGTTEERRFATSFFELPTILMSGDPRRITEQNIQHGHKYWETITTNSDEFSRVIRDTYLSGVKSAAEYAGKFIEISNANAATALEFMTQLMETTSLSALMDLSATQMRKNFACASIQNKTLWDVAHSATTEAVEPLTKSVTKTLLNAI